MVGSDPTVQVMVMAGLDRERFAWPALGWATAIRHLVSLLAGQSAQRFEAQLLTSYSCDVNGLDQHLHHSTFEGPAGAGVSCAPAALAFGYFSRCSDVN
jgi:hypothetical protein